MDDFKEYGLNETKLKELQKIPVKNLIDLKNYYKKIHSKLSSLVFQAFTKKTPETIRDLEIFIEIAKYKWIDTSKLENKILPNIKNEIKETIKENPKNYENNSILLLEKLRKNS